MSSLPSELWLRVHHLLCTGDRASLEEVLGWPHVSHIRSDIQRIRTHFYVGKAFTVVQYSPTKVLYLDRAGTSVYVQFGEEYWKDTVFRQVERICKTKEGRTVITKGPMYQSFPMLSRGKMSIL